MNNEKQVAELVAKLKEQGGSMSDAVWQTALACVGWAYVFGAAGELCTVANRKRRYSDSHPTIKTACKAYDGGKCDGCKWYPGNERTRIFDCRGLTRWCLEQFGINLAGSGATSQWNTASNWLAKGAIKDAPDDVLVCLFVYNKDTNKMEHTGFGFKGASCECSSGVQYFAKRKSKWTHWAIPVGVSGDMPDYKPTLRRGDKGEWVTLAQTQLVNRGYDIGVRGVDGDFGRATEAAVKQFQKDNGLVQDGIIGQKTWEALSDTNPILYTVTIPHLTKTAAEKFMSEAANYQGATMTEEGR